MTGLAAGLLEIVEPDVGPGATRLRDQVNDRIGRTAHRHRHRNRVLEAFRVWIFRGVRSSRPSRRCAGRIRWPCGCGRHQRPGSMTPPQGHADRFRDRGHGRSGAHGHAGAVAARDAGLDVDPVLVEIFRPPLVPVFPGVGAGASVLPFQLPRSIGLPADRSRADSCWWREQQRRRGLVAAAHQHHAVDGMAAQQLSASIASRLR